MIESTKVYAEDPLIAYEGRFFFRAEGEHSVATADWPCTTLSLKIEGSGSVSVYMNGGGNRFLIRGCGQPKIIWSSQDLELYSLCEKATGLLTVRKMTEADGDGQKMWEVHHVLLQGVTLTPQSAPKRKLEFFGDSDTAGYCTDGKASDPVDTDYQNLVHANCDDCYPGILGRLLDASISVEAWSGKGCFQNCNLRWTDHTPRMPFYWNHTLATDDSATTAWSFNSRPDAVIIYLGGNDYNSPVRPTDG